MSELVGVRERNGQTPGVDAVIAGLASRQHRVVTRRQLMAAGVGSEAIRHRLSTGRLYWLHRGVYAVGVPKIQPEGRGLAAVLACGDTAVLSHRSAAVHLRLFHGLLDDLPHTRSELERRFLRLVHDAGLPAPLVNRRQEGHRVDFAWPQTELVVETDGRATHDNPYAFHQDHARDLDLELAGWRVIRLSWPQVVNESERVRELLRRRLDALSVQSVERTLE